MISIAEPIIGQNELDGVKTVVEEGRFVAGEEVEHFESSFARYVGTDHAIGIANGTAALHTALEAAGIGRGDRVITTPFSFIATANAIRLAGAEPVFADIEPDTLNLSPRAVEAELADNGADAILVVHLYGQPAKMAEFAELAAQYDATLVEDAAQAHGSKIDGKHVGSFGDVGCFSFYPTKNMTTGEGGMVVTDDDDIARRARQFINHGRTDSYSHAQLGHNYRMTNIAGAIGEVQLMKLPYFVDQRRRNARQLDAILDGTDLTLPARREGTTHSFHQYTIRVDERDALQSSLEARDVGAGIYYPTPIHEQPAYDDWDVEMPVAEAAAEQVLSLPVHPMLSESEVDQVAQAVIDAVGSPWEVNIE